MEKERNHPALNLLMVGLILLGLYLGQHLLIPLVMAVVVWYLINAIGAQIGRVNLGGVSAPKWLRTTLAIGVVFSFFWFVGRLVVANLEEFALVSGEYDKRFQELLALSEEYFGISTFGDISEKVDVNLIATKTLDQALGFVSSLLVVIFYVIFLMIEQGIFGSKLDLILTKRKKRASFFQTIRRIDDSMKKYMSVKSLLSLVVAVCMYITLISFGVDFAILWAFLAFLLNFIPFVGSLIAILLPTLLSLLQFGDPVITVAIFAILNVVQVVIGNYVEPKMVGKSLNLSPLVVILALAFWGALWGVAGMFLCVPITVALMIVLSQFPSTRTFAILLSAGNDPSGETKPHSGEQE